MEIKSSKGSKKVADKHRSGREEEEEEEGRAFSDQRIRNKLEKEKPKGKHSSRQPQMEEIKSSGSGSNKLPENQSQKRKHLSSIEETHVFDDIVEEEEETEAGVHLQRSLNEIEKPKREHSRSQTCEASSKPQVKGTKSPRSNNQPAENQNQKREHQSRIQEIQVSGAGSIRSRGEQRSVDELEKDEPKRKHSRIQPSAAFSSQQIEVIKSPGSSKRPEKQSWERKHQSRTQETQVSGAESNGSRVAHFEQRSNEKPKRKHSRVPLSAAASSSPQVEEIKSPGSNNPPEKHTQRIKHQSRTQETQVSGAESNGSRVAHLEQRSNEKLKEEKPKRKHSRVPLSAAASSSPQVEEIMSPGSNNLPEKHTQRIKHQSSTQETQVSASVSSNPPTNQKQHSRIPDTQVAAAAAGFDSSQPLRQFAGIIGECRGPFEQKLTNSDVFEHWLSITNQNYTEFIKPFSGNNDGRRTVVTLYNAEDGMSREYYLTLKFWGPKCLLDGVCKRDREWNGDGEWKRFREEHKSLIKVNGIVKIWTFRHARNRRIYCVITSGTGDSLESSKPLPKDQKQRSSTWKD